MGAKLSKHFLKLLFMRAEKPMMFQRRLITASSHTISSMSLKQAAVSARLLTKARRIRAILLSGSSRRKASLHGDLPGVKADPAGTSSALP